jgi:hypothetical protein
MQLPQHKYDDEDYNQLISKVMAGRQKSDNTKVAGVNQQPSRFRNNNRIKKKKLITTILLFAISIFIVATIYYFLKLNSTSPFEVKLKKLQSEVNFTLYAPEYMPTGYVPQLDKITASDGVIFASLFSTDGTKPILYINQQSIPPNAKITDLLGSNAQPEPVKSKYGNMYLTSNESSSSGILVTNESWIIFSGEKSIGTDTYLELAASLKPLN